MSIKITTQNPQTIALLDRFQHLCELCDMYRSLVAQIEEEKLSVLRQLKDPKNTIISVRIDNE